MQTGDTKPIYDSLQRGNPALNELREIFRYKNLVSQMVRRDIISRYKRSALGVAWTMLNPLGTTVVLSLVFSQVFGRQGAYAVYVLSGIMPWTFFSQSTSACMVGLIWGGSLLRKIYLPRTIFAVSAIGTAMVNLVLSVVPLLLIMLIQKVPVTINLLFLPLPLLFLSMFALGVGLLLSSLALYFPDVREMYQVILTAWMYLSPIIYTEEMLPPDFLWVIRLNPMYYIINVFRAPIYDGIIPDLTSIMLSGGIAIATLLLGWIIFTRRAEEFSYRA